MIPRIVKRRIRPMWLAALASAAWVNRNDVKRWAEFLRRAVSQRQSRPLGDLITEAKVRAAVSSDPVLRRDPALNAVHCTCSTLNWLARPDHSPPATAGRGSVPRPARALEPEGRRRVRAP
jgi:hypothetical protein